MPQTSSGIEILRAIGAGDEGEFQRFYEATSNAAYSLAMRMLRDTATALEACESAYSELWRQARTLAPNVDPQTWLRGEDPPVCARLR